MSQQALLEHWRAWLAPNESAFDFFARVRTEPLLTGLALLDKHAPAPLRPGSLLEITGPSGVGKTELLVEVRGATVAAVVALFSANPISTTGCLTDHTMITDRCKLHLG